jgi:hypothetical protein
VDSSGSSGAAFTLVGVEDAVGVHRVEELVEELVPGALSASYRVLTGPSGESGVAGSGGG